MSPLGRIRRMLQGHRPPPGEALLYQDQATGRVYVAKDDGSRVDLEATGGGGGGSGDMVGPSASVADEVMLYANTSGKLAKRATTTGLAKLTSGVLSTAVADTDYALPATVALRPTLAVVRNTLAMEAYL